jgi:hypothetical protein
VAIVLLIFDWKLWRTRLPSASPAVRSQPVRTADATPVSLDRPETAT